MNILITNDDGIDSYGIELLAKTAVKYGKVTIVAPDKQNSAMSHAVTFNRDMLLKKVDFPIPVDGAYTLDATPADCVRSTFLGAFDKHFDAVFSGINDGANVGCDILYSATLGAGLEALLYDVPVICFSKSRNGTWELTEDYIDEVMEQLINKTAPEHCLWNVNFPGIPADKCKGILHDRTIDRLPILDDTYVRMPNKENTWTIKLNTKDETRSDDTSDMHALFDGYISVGPVKNMIFK